jgi:hypothetical protein
MRRFGLSVLVAVALISARAEARGPGAVFLMIFPDARTTALGGCGTALTDLDANTYYNPAGIAFGPRIAATWTHVNWLPGLYPRMSYEHAGVAYRLDERLCLAANVIYLTTGETDVIDEHGSFLGRYRTWDLSPGITGAYRILPYLSAGMTLKGIYSFLVPGWVWEVMPELGIEGDGDAFSMALDCGVQYRPARLFSMGLALSNFGPGLNYTSRGEADPLPAILRGGFALSPRLPGPVEVRLVGDVWRDLVTTMPHVDSFVDFWEQLEDGIGLELRFAKLASIRLGYFEDVVGQRGGILLKDPMGFTRRVSLLRQLFWPRPGEAVGWGFCWGVGVEFSGLKFDVGVDEDIYDFPTRNVRFQLSGRF